MFKVGPCGFHITFENGWTVSVQFGSINYCARRTIEKKLATKLEDNESATAEIAAWDSDNNWYDFGNDKVLGWQSPKDVLNFLILIENLPRKGKK